ncbi:MAG: vWA domain-containing protein [Terriglobia bacterium]
MGNELEARRAAEKALDVERRRMNEALARLQPKELKHGRGQGRLIFALDLTGSRAHSLKQARIATAAMFEAIKSLGAVAVKLVYYRGSECKASAWQDDPAVLAEAMRRLSCEAGLTQIARVLRLALDEPEPVCGVVFVGDHCEDDADELRGLAQALGRKSMPVFVFHECADYDGRSIDAKPVFKSMAGLSGGVYVEFKPDSGAALREMLSSIGALAAAGLEGVNSVALPETPAARELQGQLRLLAPARRPSR